MVPLLYLKSLKLSQCVHSTMTAFEQITIPADISRDVMTWAQIWNSSIWQYLLNLFHSQNILNFLNIMADFTFFPYHRLIIPHDVHIFRDQVNKYHYPLVYHKSPKQHVWYMASHAHPLQTKVKNPSLWNLSHKTIKYHQSIIKFFLCFCTYFWTFERNVNFKVWLIWIFTLWPTGLFLQKIVKKSCLH